jgi:methionine-gamma-lyase
MSKHKMHPESKMMSHGYKPEWSEGAIKCPIFQTSTFVFPTAEAGKAFFQVAAGLRPQEKDEKVGLIYSRLNNPDLEILEDRLCLWDEAEACAVFESGMSAISTAMMEFLSPGDLLLFSTPVYGGTDHFIKHVLIRYGIQVMEFHPDETKEDLIRRVREMGLADRLRMIFLETPANPTNALYDMEMYRQVADHFTAATNRPLVAVDNTYLGPVFQHPLKHGADLVLYSATKYIGGHSDVIAGACLGSLEHIRRIKSLRTYLGSMAGPWTGWLLMRSLETLKIRMERQAANARVLAEFLLKHPKVHDVHYLGFLTEADGRQYEIFKKQCLSPGAMISFEVGQTEEEAFAFLNNLHLIKLAVSLGSTESLIQHPASMTHAGVEPERKIEMGIKDNLIRLSVGIEHPDDLIYDIEQALTMVPLAEEAAV